MKVARRCFYLISLLLPLFYLKDLRATFYSGLDWNNQLWLIGYFGEYFRHHFVMPTEINTSNAVGITIPIFYGTLLYPLIGFVSSFTGASLALRLSCFVMLAVQFSGIYCASRSIFRSRLISYALAITSVWSVYSLTNLYNRSAITEYFATGLMMASIGFIFSALLEDKLYGKLNFIWLAAISTILFLGIHPPTAFIGGIYFILLGFLLLTFWTKYRLFSVPVLTSVLLLCIILGLCLAPWIYATLTVGPHLIQWNHPGVIQFFPDRSDSWIGRLSPIPYDKLSNIKPITKVSTPYLETSINFGYILILGFLIIIALKDLKLILESKYSFLKQTFISVIGITLIWITFISLLSTSRELASHFLFLNQFIQFAYRFVSHINAALLVLIFSVGVLLKLSDILLRNKKNLTVIALFCIGCAGINLYIKLAHAKSVLIIEDSKEYLLSEDRSNLAKDGRIGLAHMYATPDKKLLLSESEYKTAVNLNFRVSTSGPDFGAVYTSRIHLEHSSWVITNVVTFPWSKIILNNKELDSKRSSPDGTFIAIFLPKGDSYLQWHWRANPIWRVLNILSSVSFLLMIVGTLFVLFLTLKRAETLFSNYD